MTKSCLIGATFFGSANTPLLTHQSKILPFPLPAFYHVCPHWFSTSFSTVTLQTFTFLSPRYSFEAFKFTELLINTTEKIRKINLHLRPCLSRLVIYVMKLMQEFNKKWSVYFLLPAHCWVNALKHLLLSSLLLSIKKSSKFERMEATASEVFGILAYKTIKCSFCWLTNCLTLCFSSVLTDWYMKNVCHKFPEVMVMLSHCVLSDQNSKNPPKYSIYSDTKQR